MWRKLVSNLMKWFRRSKLNGTLSLRSEQFNVVIRARPLQYSRFLKPSFAPSSAFIFCFGFLYTLANLGRNMAAELNAMHSPRRQPLFSYITFQIGLHLISITALLVVPHCPLSVSCSYSISRPCKTVTSGRLAAPILHFRFLGVHRQRFLF